MVLRRMFAALHELYPSVVPVITNQIRSTPSYQRSIFGAQCVFVICKFAAAQQGDVVVVSRLREIVVTSGHNGTNMLKTTVMVYGHVEPQCGDFLLASTSKIYLCNIL